MAVELINQLLGKLNQGQHTSTVCEHSWRIIPCCRTPHKWNMDLKTEQDLLDAINLVNNKIDDLAQIKQKYLDKLCLLELMAREKNKNSENRAKNDDEQLDNICMNWDHDGTNAFYIQIGRLDMVRHGDQHLTREEYHASGVLEEQQLFMYD